MATIDVSSSVPLTAQATWDHVSDLSQLDQWLVLLEGWRSPLPEQLHAGVTVEGVVSVKGMRNRVTWTVTQWDPPHRVSLEGKGKAGTGYDLDFTVEPDGNSSRLNLRVDLKGRAFFGPLGSAAARTAKGDIDRSLALFVERFGS
jgi:carbon monoxide dehydrogenase subunit G